MKILILTSNTGGGHNSAAYALQAEGRRRGLECDVLDGLIFQGKLRNFVVSQGHTFAYKHLTKLYGLVYVHEEHGSHEHYYRENARGVQKLCDYILDNGYDVVISVHPFTALMMTHVLNDEPMKSRTSHVRSYFVLTDHACAPGVDHIKAHHMFVAHDLLDEMTAAGLPRETISEVGIPVAREFFAPLTKEEAKAQLGLPADKRLVLLASGSMGCGPIKQLAKKLNVALPADCCLAVVCGTNKKLQRQLQALNSEGRFLSLGFVNNMSVWMHAADVLVSKPGGLTSTEAMSCQLPSVFLEAVRGPETHNLEYLLPRGCALYGNGVEGSCQAVLDLLASEEDCARMRAQQKKYFAEDAAASTFDYVTTFRAF